VEDEKIVVSQGLALVVLLASVATGVIGVALLPLYNGSFASYLTPVFYSALYIAVLDFFACALCFMGGVALLKKRFFPLTLASIIFLLGSGIATPIAWSLDGHSWLNGLLFGTFQIVISIIAIAFLVKLKTKK
jgi:hypothetical protein